MFLSPNFERPKASLLGAGGFSLAAAAAAATAATTAAAVTATTAAAVTATAAPAPAPAATTHATVGSRRSGRSVGHKHESVFASGKAVCPTSNDPAGLLHYMAATNIMVGQPVLMGTHAFSSTRPHYCPNLT
ncbi:uncharacterized protein SEPMUDRAFT_114245 [Sphaerulina musiva SO2202]|uniref:Uncharacterized protein n=1 Tax=Sphaerulina musiva (strain SO2202) TaxID=692275 RepID=M3C4B7_SPHMS|nr:uncharacterized protein SEPMUDRAFT_114245 [Sphaerulina musiva SO2202]EMF15121.1 hypothetical protein SEPMUDRAFT_114245 [Sphaerulina musiva SO2202]